MKKIESSEFHKFYGLTKQRITYQKKDFVDYVLMIVISAAIINFAYAKDSLIAISGLSLCVFMIAVFPIRHGIKLGLPVIVRRPSEILYLIIHKIQNAKAPYFIAIAMLLLENYAIYLTPELPHKIEFVRKMAIFLFYAHFLLLTGFRTAILLSHLLKKELVREILMQSVWQSVLKVQPNITLEIIHAYFTGVLSHIMYLATWYLIISYFNHSIILLPITCVIAFLIEKKFDQMANYWFYRDHWLGHNSEVEFVYAHGPHHDAIPSSLIGVAGSGFIEGVVRSGIGFPTAFYNPVMTALYYTAFVIMDILGHQYIPGIFPKRPREFYEVAHHATHHFGRIEPYGFAMNLDQSTASDSAKKIFAHLPEELSNSLSLDEQLTGYEWDNPRHRWFLDLIDNYQDTPVEPAQDVKD